MLEFRTFRNTDPPHIVRLWEAAGLGRGAALGLGSDFHELVNFAQSYFDRDGLILAEEDGQPVGFAQCGFGVNDQRTAIDPSLGILAAVIVHPDYRRRGIGRELVSRACQYLRTKGASQIQAGQTPPHNPFYMGLYGGSQPAGFLVTDELIHPFLLSLGAQEQSRHRVYQRELNETSDPIHFRIMQNRRRHELEIAPHPKPLSWWWATRFGRLDSLEFRLIPRSGGKCSARLTVVGLDGYIHRWQQRAVGLVDVHVPDPTRRRSGLGQTLLVETCRRLRDELVTLVEVHAPVDNTGMISLVECSGFTQVDEGVVYRLP